ncbi:hypothetical protein SCP_1502460 [Sparassis crispa]|uniref:BTB domain-containing protein n=1 Tax=Sparassis crispa TaxID=139825 RepID=A0A401H484_9APHY|nr:hypothetical protein SCP_1502460 [Sparassis crispa]GBE89238.1 hypothetical protein SCP_1502460 [Sparassis crispa]
MGDIAASSTGRKRCRTDEVDTVRLPQRSDEFWFTDGSIVLIAEGRAFRVHQSILAKNSQVFTDLFSISQPVEQRQSETIDGCPLVHLSDSADDLLHLLRAVYDGRNYLRHDRIAFARIAALVRMSHKYEIDDLLEDALARIRTCFPDDFDVWESETGEHDSSSVMTFSPTDAITVVNLGRLTNTLSLLPVALYRCCQLRPQDLLSGSGEGDRVVEQLTTDDLARCIGARGVLVHEAIAMLRDIAAPVTSVYCRTHYICQEGMGEILSAMYDHCKDELSIPSGRIHPLQSSSDVISQEASLCEVCDNCQLLLKSRDVEARERLWNRLPDIVGLRDAVPNWGST